MCCEKCGKMIGFFLLIFGVLFLLGNLGIWNFWNIQWYTVAFLFGGFSFFCTNSCPMCKKEKK